MALIPTLQLAETAGPARKSAQRLRWFVSAFEAQVATSTRDTGQRFAIDQGKLCATFTAWLEAFEAQKPAAVEDRPAYVGFAAGLMLRELIAHAPLRRVDGPAGDPDDPAVFWPEGYVYVAFCLNVRGHVLEKDYHLRQSLSDDLRDLRTWWSFRENVEADGATALAFLDLFAGEAPEWTTPDLFRRRGFQKLAQDAFEEIAAPPE